MRNSAGAVSKSGVVFLRNVSDTDRDSNFDGVLSLNSLEADCKVVSIDRRTEIEGWKLTCNASECLANYKVKCLKKTT